MSPQQIVAALMEQYRLFQQRKQQRQARSVPAGRGNPRNRPRGRGPPALAAIGRVGEQRAYCRKPVHLRAKCPNLHPEVRKYLALGEDGPVPGPRVQARPSVVNHRCVEVQSGPKNFSQYAQTHALHV